MEESTKIIVTEEDRTTVVDSSLQPTRSFSELTEEEKARVMELYGELDDFSDEGIIKFGSTAAAESAREADEFLRTTKVNDLGEFEDSVLDLQRNLRSIDVKELSMQNPSSLAKIPLIGKKLAESAVGKRVEGVVARQQTIKKVVDESSVTLEKVKLSLRKDLLQCTATRKSTVEFAKQLELEYIALYEKRRALEVEYEQFTTSADYNPNDLDQSEYAAKLQDGIQAIERKMDNTLRYRINTIETIPNLALIRSVDTALIHEIDDLRMHIIPEWNKAFQQAILSYRASNAAKIVQSAKQATNEILLTAARVTSEAVLATAQIVETPQIATATLEEKNRILIDTCTKLVSIAQAASQERANEAVRLKQMEGESLTIHGGRKTIQIMQEAEKRGKNG